RMIAARVRLPTTRIMINDQGLDALPPTTHELVSQLHPLRGRPGLEAIEALPEAIPCGAMCLRWPCSRLSRCF
ncbi:hypothetical protein ACH4OH_30255, partial [Streptomyces albidoflavus]